MNKKTTTELWLNPTFFIDCNNSLVQETAQRVVAGKSGVDAVKALFEWCRDSVRFTPFVALFVAEENRASSVLKKMEGNCIQKAVLLCALLRAAKFPSRLAFACCVNHKMSETLVRFLGTNRIPYHGVAEVLLNNKWIKLAPAFDTDFCRRHNLPVAEFDAQNGALVPERTENGELFFEYLYWYGSFDDLPFEQVVEGFKKEYMQS